MHLVLKSSKATGDWNFLRPTHNKNIRRIIEKFAFYYGVRIVSFANASNHIHLQLKLSNRFAYAPFIRAITGAIAMSITGRSRWKKAAQASRAAEDSNVPERPAVRHAARGQKLVEKFWDYRPFTRVAESYKAYLNLKDYIRMNEVEAAGWRRDQARSMVYVEKQFRGSA